MGGGDVCNPPFSGATETTFHSSEKWKLLTIDAWDNFDITGKKSFSYLKERSQKCKKIVKDCTHPKNPSPIKAFPNVFKANERVHSILLR